MNHNAATLLRYLVPVVFVGIAHYVYFGASAPEVDPNASRVRFLDIPTEHKNEPDALAEIYIEGEINAVVVKEFNETVSRHSLKHARVVLNSDGGSVEDAVLLGSTIRNLGFSTDVGEYSGTWNDSYAASCFSACTIVFLGGEYRFFHPKSEFGVHQYKSEYSMALYTFDHVEAYAQVFSGYLLDYVTEMGIEPEFYEITVAQTNDDIEYIGYEDLIRLKVVNNGAKPPTWEMAMVDSRPVLKGRQERLGQSGQFTLRCENGPVIEFINDRKKYTLKNIPSPPFELLLDKQKSDISKQINSRDITVRDEQLIVQFRPTPAQVIDILGSDLFGLKLNDSTNTWFTQSISIDEDRRSVSNYFKFCQTTDSL